MSYLKPQNPIKLNNDYIYPLTTADQVITGSGERLNSLFKKTIKETTTLQAANWSDTKPYTQTITLNYSVDDYNVDANVAYGDEDNAALHAAAGCISYIKKNHKNITFYCLKSKPEVDIPIEITGTCRNTIATVEEGIKLNFDIVAYASEEEMLADTPIENTIGVITKTPITGYKFSATEPEDMVEGEVWIRTGINSDVAFDIVDGFTICPLSAKQYISGTWANVTAMSYQGGEWVDWARYLFKDGTTYKTLDYSGYVYESKYSKKQATISENSIVLSNSGALTACIIGSDEAIDLTGYSKIIVNAVIQTGQYFVYAATTKTTVLSNVATWKQTNVSGEYEVDISMLNGKYYLALSTWNNETGGSNIVNINSWCIV